MPLNDNTVKLPNLFPSLCEVSDFVPAVIFRFDCKLTSLCLIGTGTKSKTSHSDRAIVIDCKKCLFSFTFPKIFRDIK